MVAEATLLRGGLVVDPATGRDGIADVLIRDGRIAEIGAVTDRPAETIACDGLVVAPGLIDVHVHLRSPGFPEKETIASGTAAAAAGGFTTIFCMPNTQPALDTVETIAALRCEVAAVGDVRVLPIAAITSGRRGEEPVDYLALASAGVVGFSDDGDTTANSAIMRGALAASTKHGLPVMVHCEDKALAAGAMHEGEVSAQLGIPGIPGAAEEIIIARDIMLAELTGGWLHVCHVSTPAGADLIRQGKARGVRVTGEAMPHHLLMTDKWVAGSRRLVNVDEPEGEPGAPADPNTKVNPPLRPFSDAAGILRALQQGTLDIVATDHAPHAAPEKSGTTFVDAAFGLSGLEFALPAMLALVRAGHCTVPDVVRWLATEPARLWGLPTGTLEIGSPADVVVFDPNQAWTVEAAGLKTQSANTPLLGMQLRGRVKHTFVDGSERYRDLL